ncbi:MAG TPA: M48 family metalloprotease [Solirubrobacteraceae bacterium]|nr:M48 family metalloprotease [Solirubrobacteraceae bacterium]
MKLSDRAGIVVPLGLTALAAGGAARLLAPRERLPSPLPVEPETVFSAEEIRAGRAYQRPQRRIRLVASALELGALAGVVRTGGRPQTDGGRSAARSRPAVGAAGAAAAAVGLSLGGTLLGLPTRALSRRRALAAGLSTDSWSSWAGDLVKATAIEAGLSAGLLAGSSLLAARLGPRWWRAAAGGAVGVGVLAGLLGPVLLDPVFNRFDPLPDGETRRDVLALAAAAGVQVKEVFSVDASRRTTAVNAYVNGLGPTKRVVLYDTLLKDYGRDEVRFVVAHELGHVHHRDVVRQLIFLALVAPPAALSVQQLTLAWAGELTGARAVPALSLAARAAGLPLVLGVTGLSRAVERRTDQFGLEVSQAPEALISFFRRIAVQNRADVTAPGPVRARLATHPPITERIGAALAFQNARAAGDRDSRTRAGS